MAAAGVPGNTQISALELAGLSCAAAGTSAATLLLKASTHDYWLFNDFDIYWLAGRLVAAGRDPYDVAALAALAEKEHVNLVVELGYVYPMPFALLMVPLSKLPLTEAAWLFTAVSVAVFAIASALLIVATPYLRGAGRRVRFVVAIALGTYPPVACSAVVGQANLLVYSLLAVGVMLLVSPPTRGTRWSLVAGLTLGLAAVVKVVPLVIGVCLGLGRRWAVATCLCFVFLISVVAAGAMAPPVTRGSSSLASLFAPDPWWTNQSINGFVTRLFVDTSRTRAILPAIVSPSITSLFLTGLFVLATALVLWRARECIRQPTGLSLAIGLLLVSATIGAPKISFWNHLPSLVAVWLLVRTLPQPTTARSLTRTEYVLLAAWFFGAGIQWAVNFLPDELQGSFSGIRTLLNSSALYGLFALWLLLAHRLAHLPSARVAESSGRSQSGHRVRRYAAIYASCILAMLLIFTAILPPSPRPDMELGVTYSPRYAESLGLDPRSTYQRMLDDLEFDTIRLPVYWDLVEPRPGEFDFSAADFYVLEAQRHGRAVVPVLGFKVPRWPECFAPTWAGSLDAPQKQAAILSLLQAEVAHFGLFDNVSQWQVENEPLLPFGECGGAGVLTLQFVAQEVRLVHDLDKRPVLITDSGELSSWFGSQRLGDRFGCTLYRSVWFPNLGMFSYPIPPRAYAVKDRIVRVLSGTTGQTIVAELQAEAWFQARGALSDVPVAQQSKEFPPSIILDNVEYARETGFGGAYLWGVEWWYWMDAQGYPDYLVNAQAILAPAHAERSLLS